MTLTERARSIYDRHGEKLRYLVVGVGNTVIGYGLFVVLLWALGPSLRTMANSPIGWLSSVGHAYYIVVQWTAWVCAVPISTTTMKYLAFRSKGRWLPQVARAYFIYLPAQGISSVMLWATVKLAGMSPQAGQLVTIAVTTVFSYVGHKYFTFRAPLEVGEVPPRDMVESD